MLPCCGLSTISGPSSHVESLNGVLSRIILEGKARNVTFVKTADRVVIYLTINYR